MPLMVLAVAATGYLNKTALGFWLALPCPGVTCWLFGAEMAAPGGADLMADTAMNVPLVPLAVRRDLPMMVAVGLLGYALVAGALFVRWRRVMGEKSGDMG